MFIWNTSFLIFLFVLSKNIISFGIPFFYTKCVICIVNLYFTKFSKLQCIFVSI